MDEFDKITSLPDLYLNSDKILDEEGNELDINNLDLNHGHLVDESILIEDRKYVPGKEGKRHFKVDRFYFDDGTSMEITDEDDPHVEVIDADKCEFWYKDQGEGKEFSGLMDCSVVVDEEPVAEVLAQKIYENIRRYKKYTPEEQAEFDAYMAKETNKQILLDTGLERLMNTENNIDDIMLALAEMIGA